MKQILYGMTEILSGEQFFLELLSVNGNLFNLFLDEFVETVRTNNAPRLFRQCLISFTKLSGRNRKCSVRQLSGRFAGVESDRAILERSERLVGRKRNQKPARVVGLDHLLKLLP